MQWRSGSPPIIVGYRLSGPYTLLNSFPKPLSVPGSSETTHFSSVGLTRVPPQVIPQTHVLQVKTSCPGLNISILGASRLDGLEASLEHLRRFKGGNLQSKQS